MKKNKNKNKREQKAEKNSKRERERERENKNVSRLAGTDRLHSRRRSVDRETHSENRIFTEFLPFCTEFYTPILGCFVCACGCTWTSSTEFDEVSFPSSIFFLRLGEWHITWRDIYNTWSMILQDSIVFFLRNWFISRFPICCWFTGSTDFDLICWD